MDQNTDTKKIIKVVDLWSDDIYAAFPTREEAEEWAMVHLNNTGIYYLECRDES